MPPDRYETLPSRSDASGTVLPVATCVVRYALERHAQARGEDTYAVFDAGGAWTFAGLLQEVRKVAAGLQDIGVGQGDRVLVMMPNGPPGLLALFAANYIGAAFVPINTAYRGRLLQQPA
jgi:carnitine-CoA ligase